MPNLTEAQQRSIKVLAWVVEEKLMDMEATMAYFESAPDTTTRYTYDLPEETSRLLLLKIQAMRAALQEMKRTYGLEQQNRKLKKELHAKSAFLWEELSGATFKRLEGYGPVDEAERADYEALQNRMTTLAEEMMTLCNH
ncbi:hypothetical protein I2I11_02975 [Pontibacter sp. 172403-2]|uniref:hypothetical protein n=1 Tax=Pontibacter rufus TaxID=2791028 RepID=UPI0018B001BF|nr:hypothetical protein [Pontibacter sp. 172403-2]MBF9252246.1 hypothetical protein [Pontibacter sp. 172403-2]